jgi:hypothetical protein
LSHLLATVPLESVEGLLVTFDALVNVSDDRAAAAQMLRTAASECSDPERGERLKLAAADIEAHQPCAFTPDGLSAQQAAAAQTMTADEWERHVAEHPLPPPPGESFAPQEDEDEEDAEEDYLDEAPPTLPHLPVRHFFAGLVVRVAQDFADGHGRAVCATDLLRLLACNSDGDNYTLACLDRNVFLTPEGAGHDRIIENAGNAWFQPVPRADCLEDLAERIHLRLNDAEDESEEEDDDNDGDSLLERIETIREDVERCQEWISQAGERGPAPQYRTARVVAGIFGPDDDVTVWLRLLFAAIAVFHEY